MNDDRFNAGRDDPEDTSEEDLLDKFDEPVIAADDTGMLAGEKFITDEETEEGLAGGEAEP